MFASVGQCHFVAKISQIFVFGKDKHMYSNAKHPLAQPFPLGMDKVFSSSQLSNRSNMINALCLSLAFDVFPRLRRSDGGENSVDGHRTMDVRSEMQENAAV